MLKDAIRQKRERMARDSGVPIQESRLRGANPGLPVVASRAGSPRLIYGWYPSAIHCAKRSMRA